MNALLRVIFYFFSFTHSLKKIRVCVRERCIYRPETEDLKKSLAVFYGNTFKKCSFFIVGFFVLAKIQRYYSEKRQVFEAIQLH
jgi:hypothetical protein